MTIQVLRINVEFEEYDNKSRSRRPAFELNCLEVVRSTNKI